MSGARILSMLVYMVFLLWCAGLETLLGDTLGAWTPALSLVLACAVIARAEDEDLWWLVPLTAIARAPFAPDEPSVLVGGTFLALWVALLVRRVLDAAGVLGRATTAFVCVASALLWSTVSGALRAADGDGTDSGLSMGVYATVVSAGLSSALLAAVLGGVLQSLPGLAALRRRAW
jgi:hypothetical protein